MLFVARVDPLGRIAEFEIDPLLEPGGRGEKGSAELASQSGIYRRLEHDDRARSETRSDQ